MGGVSGNGSGAYGEVRGQVDLHPQRARRLGRAAALSGHVVSRERVADAEEGRGGEPIVVVR